MRIFLKRLVCILLSATAFSVNAQNSSKGEIIYHLFQRSFYDSNGDGHGDLNGVAQKLNYLQELGVTSILLLPLYESVYYHNYFAVDFHKIDPEFGTMQDYINLVKEVHRRGDEGLYGYGNTVCNRRSAVVERLVWKSEIKVQ